MQSHSRRAETRADVAVCARPPLVERRLARYPARVRERVHALARSHPRLADLAASFPALLVALAVPRRGCEPLPVVERVIAGEPLAQIAEAAAVPMWLRRLGPEWLAEPLPLLPDGPLFRRAIANHLPRSPRTGPAWLRAVADAARWGHEPLAIWIAREVTRNPSAVSLHRLPLLALWAWHSTSDATPRQLVPARQWHPSLGFQSALEAATAWKERTLLQIDLGYGPLSDMWLAPGHVDGFDFVPLASAEEIDQEAQAMESCLRSRGHKVAHDRARLWSVRRSGERVATLSIDRRRDAPVVRIEEMKAKANAAAPAEVWEVALRWLNQQGSALLRPEARKWGTAPVERTAWIALWRSYWLTKRRIPSWLPLAPSRRSVARL